MAFFWSILTAFVPNERIWARYGHAGASRKGQYLNAIRTGITSVEGIAYKY